MVFRTSEGSMYFWSERVIKAKSFWNSLINFIEASSLLIFAGLKALFIIQMLLEKKNYFSVVYGLGGSSSSKSNEKISFTNLGLKK